MPWIDAFKVSYWILTLLRISTKTKLPSESTLIQFCFRIDHWFSHGANIKVAHPIACDVAVRRFFWAVPGTAGSRLGGSSHLNSWENHQQSAVIPDLCAYRCQMMEMHHPSYGEVAGWNAAPVQPCHDCLLSMVQWLKPSCTLFTRDVICLKH